MRPAAERFTAAVCCVIVAPWAVKIEAVSKVSGWGKARVFAKVARDQAGRSRTFNAVMSAVRTTAGVFGRALHQLWLEVTGFVFLAIALIGASAGMREYEKYQSGHAAGPGRLVLAICFTLSFTWFGLSSFWRVKKRAKS